jgi:hypothetical protein
LITRALCISCWPSTTSTPDLGLDRVDADGLVEQAALLELRADLLRHALGATGLRRHGAAERRDARARAPLAEPWVVELVMPGRRAEVPHDRLVALRQQAEAIELVRRPRADVGSGDVADVAHVEAQQRSERRVGEQRLDAPEALVAEAIEADALLPVDPHRAVAVDSHHNLRSPRLLQSFAGYHAVCGATKLCGA